VRHIHLPPDSVLLLQSVVVSLFSVANCLGRMATAFVREELWGFRMPRTHYLVASCAAAAAASLLDAYATVATLPYAALVTGLPFPCMCSIIEHVSKADRTIQGKGFGAKPTTQQPRPRAHRHVSKKATAQATTQTLNSQIADPPD
jgi:hypothetical protein